MKKISILLICCTFMSLTNAHNEDMYMHGYTGYPEFDIKEQRFSLFNANGSCKYTFNDIHFHPKDFIQEGDELHDIYAETQKNCVNRILVNSLPLIEYWSDDVEQRPIYYTDDKSKLVWNTISDIPVFEEYRKLPAKEQEKFVFLVNGFIHSDRGAIDAVKSTLKIYPDIPIVGFGEIMGEHDIMTDQMDPAPTIDSKALDPIYKLAGEKQWFVMIHSNLSYRSFKKPTEPAYISDITNVLERHPNTVFLLAHAGISRNIVIANLTGLLDDLLKQYKNLYMDISFVVYENYMFPKGKVNPNWISLVEKYPDRFLFGSDNLKGYTDFFNVKKYIPFLEALKPETAKKVTEDNFNFLIDRAFAANRKNDGEEHNKP